MSKIIDITEADQGVLVAPVAIEPAPADKTTAWSDEAGAVRSSSWNTASTPDKNTIGN